MPEIGPYRGRRQKTGGRQKGTPNRITLDLRQALRDLADANANRVQEWLDRVAESDPAEAMRLWLALLRFVTPTLQAAAIADMTRQAEPRHRLAELTDGELMAIILQEHPCIAENQSAPAQPKPVDPTAPEDQLLR